MASDHEGDMPCSLAIPDSASARSVPRDSSYSASIERSVQKAAQLVLAFVFATPSGRWRAELSGEARQSQDALTLLSEGLASRGISLETDARPAGLFGLGVIQGWHVCLSCTEDEFLLKLKQGIAAGHPRSSKLGFLEHRVIASCIF